jgi:hypothetical protein
VQSAIRIFHHFVGGDLLAFSFLGDSLLGGHAFLPLGLLGHAIGFGQELDSLLAKHVQLLFWHWFWFWFWFRFHWYWRCRWYGSATHQFGHKGLHHGRTKHI